MRVLLKLGGALLLPAHAQHLDAVATDLKALADRGHQAVLVHGGGRQTTELMRSLGMEPTIVAGRRVTDAATLEVLQMVVGGKLNVDLTARLIAEGLSAVGLTGVSASLVRCRKRPPMAISGQTDKVDFGLVGDVTGVNRAFVELLLDDGHTPVIGCIAVDDAGQPFNINADVVAKELAMALDVDRLMLVTDAPGVLVDINDPSTRIARLTRADCRGVIQDGTVQGGMIAKLEEAMDAVGRGVGQVHILGALEKGQLASAVEAPGSVGTAILP